MHVLVQIKWMALFGSQLHEQRTVITMLLPFIKQRPYHIDYCFIPERWAHQIENVQIGSDVSPQVECRPRFCAMVFPVKVMIATHQAKLGQ